MASQGKRRAMKKQNAARRLSGLAFRYGETPALMAKWEQYSSGRRGSQRIGRFTGSVASRLMRKDLRRVGTK